MDTLMAAFDGRVQLLDDYVRHRVGFGTEQSAGPSAATITTKVDGSTSLAYRTWLTQWEEMRAAVDRLEYDLAAVRLHLDREQHALASPGMASLRAGLTHQIEQMNYMLLHLPKHRSAGTASTAADSVHARATLVDEEEAMAAREIPSVAKSAVEFVTVHEMTKIPKYMLNRMTQEKLNDSVLEFNKIIAERVKISSGNTAKMTKALRQRYWALKEAENADTVGRIFITDDDIKQTKTSKFRLDPSGRAVLGILRNLGRIKESRGGGRTRYILM